MVDAQRFQKLIYLHLLNITLTSEIFVIVGIRTPVYFYILAEYAALWHTPVTHIYCAYRKRDGQVDGVGDSRSKGVGFNPNYYLCREIFSKFLISYHL